MTQDGIWKLDHHLRKIMNFAFTLRGITVKSDRTKMAHFPKLSLMKKEGM